MIGLCIAAGHASADDEFDGDMRAGNPASGEVDREVDGDVDPRSSADVEAVLAEESIAAASGLLDTTAIQDARAHQRPSRFGRLDLAIAWRITEHVDDVGAQAVIDRNTVNGEPRRRGTFWLLLTWRN